MGDPYYNQAAIWDRDLAAQPAFREKLELFRRLIPGDVTTILDAGCGNGAFANALASRYQVTGLDSSAVALSHVRCSTVQADCAAMPLADRSFDLVLCSEVLEHLDDATLAATVREIARVARRHVLLSVPNREQLALRHVRCPSCGEVFHIYRHVQSFDSARLPALFPGFRAADPCICGAPQPTDWPAWMLRCRDRLGLYWRATPDQFPLCPRCGNTIFAPKRVAVELALRVAFRALRFPAEVLGRRRGDWLVILLTRSDST
jgi:SAM-dependent methyltransferase